MTRRLQFKVDLIHGPIFQSLLFFAIPLFFSNVFQQLYNTVDTMIVGHALVICHWRQSVPAPRFMIC